MSLTDQKGVGFGTWMLELCNFNTGNSRKLRKQLAYANKSTMRWTKCSKCNSSLVAIRFEHFQQVGKSQSQNYQNYAIKFQFYTHMWTNLNFQKYPLLRLFFNTEKNRIQQRKLKFIVILVDFVGKTKKLHWINIKKWKNALENKFLKY